MDSDEVDTEDDEKLVECREDYDSVSHKIESCCEKVEQFTDAAEYEYVMKAKKESEYWR